MKQINILIADDHTLTRQTLRFALSSLEQFSVIAECSTGDEAVRLNAELKPDIVLLNTDLPGISPIEATEQMRKQSVDAKILILSQHCKPENFRDLIRAGAMGCLTRSSTLEETKQAIVALDNGKKYICPQMKDKLTKMYLDNSNQPAPLSQLSRREKEITGFIQKGETSKNIAEALHISIRTVQVHRSNILKKLKLRNSLTLVRYMTENESR
jgi:two-component system invasion response regulator UvrY